MSRGRAGSLAAFAASLLMASCGGGGGGSGYSTSPSSPATPTPAPTQDGGTFDTGPIPAGATSAAITISSTAALKYHCVFHPGMVASVNGGTSGGGGGY